MTYAFAPSLMRAGLAIWMGLVAGTALSQTPTGFVGGVWNPEDLVRVPGTPWVVVSAMRAADRQGSLRVADTRNASEALPLFPAAAPVTGAPGRSVFAPHGIDIRALGQDRFELLVVDHGGGEAIDRFRLSIVDDHLAIEKVERVVLPPGAWANGVAAMPDGGFVISSMFDPRDPHFLDKFTAAQPTGTVWRWFPKDGWHALASPQLSGANGIAISPDGTIVFVAEWAARKVWRVPLDGGAPRSVPTTFLPDNLRWSEDGTLLLAGQHAEPRDLFTCKSEGHACPMGYEVVSIDPATLATKPLLSGDGGSFRATGFGAATGALRVGDTIWVGSFTGDRIGRFAMPK